MVLGWPPRIEWSISELEVPQEGVVLTQAVKPDIPNRGVLTQPLKYSHLRHVSRVISCNESVVGATKGYMRIETGGKAD
jgi:hypothetical protein